MLGIVSPGGLLIPVLLVAMLAVACASDLRVRRIPNALVASIAVLGLLVSASSDPVLPGVFSSLAGMVVGLVLWLPGWTLRMMGAGDVKLFGAAGAWLGPIGAFNASIFAAVAGGLLAFGWMLARRGRADTRQTLWLAALQPRTIVRGRSAEPRANLLPYSIAILAGVLVQLTFPNLLLAS